MQDHSKTIGRQTSGSSVGDSGDTQPGADGARALGRGAQQPGRSRQALRDVARVTPQILTVSKAESHARRKTLRALLSVRSFIFKLDECGWEVPDPDFAPQETT